MKHWLRNIALGSATLATLAATPAAFAAAFAATSHAPKAYTAKHVESSAKHAKKATIKTAKITKTVKPAEEKKADINHKNVVNGKITAIAAGVITLQDERGTTFTINTSATTEVKVEGAASTLSTLVVGDEIHVKGQTSLTAVDTITADSIMKGEAAKPAHKFTKKMKKEKKTAEATDASATAGTPTASK